MKTPRKSNQPTAVVFDYRKEQDWVRQRYAEYRLNGAGDIEARDLALDDLALEIEMGRVVLADDTRNMIRDAHDDLE